LRALEKLAVQGKTIIRAPWDSAIARLRSVDPVSTMTISSTTGAMDVRHASRTRSSFLTIRQADRNSRADCCAIEEIPPVEAAPMELLGGVV
jgi:hypothetical protein